MDDTAAMCPAFEETVVFLKHFAELEDPRQRGKVVYPLQEILLLCLTAVVAGAESITAIALFGAKRLGLLRRLAAFENGTPAHDHLGDILASLDAEQFQRCFTTWVATVAGIPEGVIAIDGKTVRRSHNRSRGIAAIHMVSAFAARQRLVLGQVKVAEKSNEIVAEQKACDFKDTVVSRDETVDADHGRIETRTTTVIHDAAWLRERHDWPALKSVVMIDTIREIAGVQTRETRLYITSLNLPACAIGPVVRSHWTVENSLHWVMDMTFRDDECRVRTDHAPANFAVRQSRPTLRSLGRRLPRPHHHRIMRSPDSPGAAAR